MAKTTRFKCISGETIAAYIDTLFAQWDDASQCAEIELGFDLFDWRLTWLSRKLYELGYTYWLFDDLDDEGIGHPKVNPNREYRLWVCALNNNWGLTPITANEAENS
jgi:hypothetical protein